MTPSMPPLHQPKCAKGYKDIRGGRKRKKKSSPGRDFPRVLVHQRTGARFGLSQPLNLSPAWGEPVPGSCHGPP